MNENKNYKSDTQMIVLNNGFDVMLKDAIVYNNNNANMLPLDSSKVIIDRNNRLLDKLEKYKKTNKDGETYYYFYQRELKDLVWILLENYANRR